MAGATRSEARDILSRPFPLEKVKQKRGQGNRTMNYISHGLVTERLNEADPNWSSEVVAEHIYHDSHGVPHCAGVTIRLTVHGVTRVEAGGPQRQDGFTNEIKNAYSDALKRAGMRFGVALEMWESLLDAEGDEDYDEPGALHSATPPRAANVSRFPQQGLERPVQAPQSDHGQQRPQAGPGAITDAQKRFLWKLTQQMGWDEHNLREFVAEQFHVDHVGKLSKQQASSLIDMLQMELEGPPLDNEPEDGQAG
ncbi:MAG: DUF1018 domain-containing protein [Desulfurellales bacterium]|nr:MAG: DUF1018 domain-containing protein [Desulfurellales bacterium]